MADYLKMVAKPSAGVLAPGEEIAAAVPCLPRGGITRRAVGSAFGVIGNLAAGDIKPVGHVLEGVTLPSILALGVTTERLLVFGMNGFTGRPNKVLHVIPMDQIAGVRANQGRAVGLKMTKLDIVFVDGSELHLDVAREHMKNGQRVTDTLAAATRLITDETAP